MFTFFESSGCTFIVRESERRRETGVGRKRETERDRGRKKDRETGRDREREKRNLRKSIDLGIQTPSKHH